MKTIARLASVGGLVLAATALFAGPAAASTGEHHAHAVFVQTDNPAGNTVVAYDRAADGALRQAGAYPTGGLGGVLTGSVVEHLASQGSLALDPDGGRLYAVNAGSNTITAFTVDGDHLDRRQVISSGGDFPVSITVHGNLVYVLNAHGLSATPVVTVLPGAVPFAVAFDTRGHLVLAEAGTNAVAPCGDEIDK